MPSWRALEERLRRVGLRGAAEPTREVFAHLGERPSDPETRRAWDLAAGALAVYRERQQIAPPGDGELVVGGGRVEWAIGRRPDDPVTAADYDRLATLIESVEAFGRRQAVARDLDTGNAAAVGDDQLDYDDPVLFTPLPGQDLGTTAIEPWA